MAVWIYRWCLRAYPAAFRARFGRDMEDLFLDSMRAAGRGRPARVRTAVSLSLRAVAGGLDERRRAPRRARGHMLDSLAQDVRHGLRAFRSHPGFSTVALLTLALGIGANTAIFSVVHAVLLRDLPFPTPDRLVAIYETNRRYDFDRGVVSPFTFDRWERGTSAFAHIAAMRSSSQTLVGAGEPERLRTQRVTPAFFDVMGVQPAIGRRFTPDEADREERVVLLADNLWRNRFGGNPAVVGQTILLEGRGWRVIGVMPPAFNFPSETQAWAPLRLAAKDRQTPVAWYLRVVARLKDDAAARTAQTELDQIAGQVAAELPRMRDRGANVVPLHQDVVANVASGLTLLQGVVAVILLIACANVANLLLAQSSARQRELSVRAAVGAGRARLFRQLLIESLTLSITGAALGVLVAMAGVRALIAASPQPLPEGLTATVSMTSLLFTAGIAILTGIVFGVGPAMVATRVEVAQHLRDGGRETSAHRGAMLRTLLVAGETALAIVLLAGAMLLVRSFAKLTSQDAGFERRGVLTGHIALPQTSYPDSPARTAFWARLFDALEGAPGVQRATGSSALPFSNWEWQSAFVVQGREDVPNDGVSIRTITPGYAEVLGIPLLAGRGFAAGDTATGTRVAIVNEAFARAHLPGLNPLGQRLSLTGAGKEPPVWLEIVGVIGNTRHVTLGDAPMPEVYRPLSQSATSEMTIALRTGGDPAAAAPFFKGAVASIDPNLPVQTVATLDALVGRSVATRRFHMRLLGLFAVLALALAVCGVYGVMSFSVAQRSREVAIRLALGAQTRRVTQMVVRQGLAPVLGGVAAGIAASLYFTRLIESQLFLTSPRDPVSLAAVCAMLVAVAALACWVPARRTTRVDPIQALRSE